DGLGPNRMADNHITRLTFEQLLQLSSSPPDSPRPAHANFTQATHRHPRLSKLRAQSALETDGEPRRHFRVQIALPGQSREQGLDSAVQVAGGNVKNSHVSLSRQRGLIRDRFSGENVPID